MENYTVVGIRFSDENKDILTKKATENHLKLSTYLRQQILKDIKE